MLRHLGEKEIVARVDQTPVPNSPDREWFTLAIKVRPIPLQKPKTFYYTFIVYPKGEYTIGSVAEPERGKDEIRHSVTLTRPFALSDREITFAELIAFSPIYEEFMREQNAKPTDAGPGANWYDSVSLCRWLSKQSGLSESDQCYADPESMDKERYPREPNPDANMFPRNWPLEMGRRGFRLPTESEWEVVARSGSRTAYGFGSDVALLDRFGWFNENSGKHVRPGRELRPNVRGLFDLHGNLWEWTHDWAGAFGESALTDPRGAQEGSERVLRGGSWYNAAAGCRTADRTTFVPWDRMTNYGFRLALTSLSGVSSPADQGQGKGAEPAGVGTE